MREVLWDVDPDAAWRDHPDFVAERTLARGTWEAISWIRGELGDDRLRAMVIASRGRMLSARQVRFWELILDLPPEDVKRWLDAPSRSLFDGPGT